MNKFLLLLTTATGLLIMALFLPIGCNSVAQSNLPVVDMKIGDRTFELEVASTDAQRQTGLMYRDSMPADHGMIFVFQEEEPLSFWMKNTRIPLDILYLDAAGKVVSVKQMQPYELRGVPSEGPAKYAIELNKGAAEKAGVKRGDRLTIPEKVLKPGPTTAPTRTPASR